MGLKKNYNNMSDKDALFIFACFGSLLMVFSFVGIMLRWVSDFSADLLFFSGCFVNATVITILFYKNDCFVHDIEEEK